MLTVGESALNKQCVEAFVVIDELPERVVDGGVATVYDATFFGAHSHRRTEHGVHHRN